MTNKGAVGADQCRTNVRHAEHPRENLKMSLIVNTEKRHGSYVCVSMVTRTPRRHLLELFGSLLWVLTCVWSLFRLWYPGKSTQLKETLHQSQTSWA